MTVPPLTPRDQPALALRPRIPVSALYFVGHDLDPLPLPVVRDRFTIGGAGADLVVPSTVSTALSAPHATIERAGTGLVVRDLASAHGIYASRARPRCDALHVEPGDVFWLADVAVLAADLPLQALRAHLACHLGLEATAAIDAAVTTVAAEGPLLLRGPTGTGARRLAAVIHATSPRHGNPFIAGLPTLGVLAFAQGVTVYIDLDATPVLPAPIAAALLDPARGLRPIFAATTERRAAVLLDHLRPRVAALDLVPLAARPADAPHLLQFLWATELDSSHNVTDLGTDALDALMAYPWPRHLEELVEHAPRLLAYHHHRNLRRAAADLGITHQTLAGHLLRLDFPCLPRRAR